MATNDFETKFGILADATINDKLPAIQKHAIGFQVIDTEGDNNEKAVGIAAYKVGSRMVYVPMFWLNGRCKGGETMYLKSEDMFLPLSEVWLNFVETGKDFATGVVRAKDSSQKGSPYRVNIMELNQLHSKRAGEVPVFSLDGVENMLVCPDDCPEISLKEHLSMFSPKAAADLAEALVGNSKLANAMFLHYTPKELEGLIGERINIARKQAADPIEIITDRTDPRVKGLTVEEKMALVHDGIVIRDGRKEASEAFVAKDDTARWTTPTETGWYNVLMEDLSTKEGYVLSVSEPYSSDKPAAMHVIFPEDDGYVLVNTKPLVDEKVVIDREIPGDKVTAARLQEGLTEEDSWRGVILTDGENSEKVNFSKSVDGSVIRLSVGQKYYTIVLTGKAGKLVFKGGVAYIPEGARIIPAKSRNSYVYRLCESILPNLDSAIMTAGYTPVKVASDGHRYVVSSTKGEDINLTYPMAMQTLVRKYNLRCKQASDILKDANHPKRTVSHKGLTFYVATAADDYEFHGDDHTITKESISASNLDDRAIQSISEAATKGTKEVLDTKILAEMAKSGYPLDRVKENINTLVKAIDRLGRTLFMFYWHNDAFEDRYGKQNMESIEDSLRDNLRNLGDLVIYLKEKTTTADEAVSIDRDKEDLSDDMV